MLFLLTLLTMNLTPSIFFLDLPLVHHPRFVLYFLDPTCFNIYSYLSRSYSLDNILKHANNPTYRIHSNNFCNAIR